MRMNQFGKTLGQFTLPEKLCPLLNDCETPLGKTKIDPD